MEHSVSGGHATDEEKAFGTQLKAINGRPDQHQGFIPQLSGAKEDPTASERAV